MVLNWIEILASWVKIAIGKKKQTSNDVGWLFAPHNPGGISWNKKAEMKKTKQIIFGSSLKLTSCVVLSAGATGLWIFLPGRKCGMAMMMHPRPVQHTPMAVQSGRFFTLITKGITKRKRIWLISFPEKTNNTLMIKPANHIFPKAKMTWNENVLDFWHHSLACFKDSLTWCDLFSLECWL